MRAAIFSGGGARCAAELGYMDVLYEKYISFNAFSGSSGGALVAALLAKGYTPKEALEIVENIDYKKIKLNLLKGTIFCHKNLESELIKIGLESFENLKYKLFVAVTEFNSPKTHYLSSGNLAKAILASTALIPTFCPIEIEGELFIDGGFSDNLPILPLKDYKYKLAINVNPSNIPFKNTLLGNIKRAGYIMLNSNIKHSISLATKYVEIQQTLNYGILQKSKFREIFAIGQEYAKQDLNYWMGL
jgi:NTE family protein